jgi:hypothetical protein
VNTVMLTAYFGRAVVAIVFILSGTWKLLNPVQFVKALARSRPKYLQFLSLHHITIVLIVAAFECAVSALLLVPGTALIGVIIAAAALISFTAFLAMQRELSAGCGCWSDASDSVPKSAYLLRNALLLSLTCVGSLSTSAPHIAASLLLCMIAAMCGMLAMSIPTVVGVSSRKAKGSRSPATPSLQIQSPNRS